TAANIYNQLDFDVALLSPNYEQFFDTSTFPLQRLRQAEALREIESAYPLYVTMSIWRCPPSVSDASSSNALQSLTRWWTPKRPLQMRELLVLGIDLDRNPFAEPIRSRVEQHHTPLKEDRRVLMNELSNPDFGWERFGDYTDWELGLQ